MAALLVPAVDVGGRAGFPPRAPIGGRPPVLDPPTRVGADEPVAVAQTRDRQAALLSLGVLVHVMRDDDGLRGRGILIGA